MESTSPWKDDKWVPGVLNKSQMIALIDAHILLGIGKDEATKDIDEDASAIDLRLGNEGFRMSKGSIKPFNKSYNDILSDNEYAEKLEVNQDETFWLNKGECYIFRIKEKLNSERIKTAPIYGQATAKSSVGRVDLIARLIVDGMKEYETFNPEKVDSGEMFVEITPITFNVKVKEGKSVSQLRFFYGKVEDSIITDLTFISSVLNLPDGELNQGTLSVDISNVILKTKEEAAAFKAKDNFEEYFELWASGKYDPTESWTIVKVNDVGTLKSVTIEKDKFYILRSKERISLPENVCIYCRAMDETLGEMRIHYAGFVQPRFGLDRADGKSGAPLIFEVRGHNVNVLLTHGEILARLFFYRMSKSVVEGPSSYSEQELKLSKIFKEVWS
jgi:dCTP deaminase